MPYARVELRTRPDMMALRTLLLDKPGIIEVKAFIHS